MFSKLSIFVTLCVQLYSRLVSPSCFGVPLSLAGYILYILLCFLHFLTHILNIFCYFQRHPLFVTLFTTLFTFFSHPHFVFNFLLPVPFISSTFYFIFLHFLPLFMLTRPFSFFQKGKRRRLRVIIPTK